jgi:hypothetical protein
MISNIQVASAEGLRSRTRWKRTVDYDPNGAPNLVSLRRASSTRSTTPVPSRPRMGPPHRKALFQNIA